MSDQKYLADGRIVRVLTALAGGRSVVELGREYDEDGDVEAFFSGTEIVSNDEIHDKPSIEAYASEIKRLEGEQRAANEKLSELRQEITLTERRVKALAIYEPLKRIEDFLAGKLTHYVIWSSYSKAPAPHLRLADGERSTTSDRPASEYDPLKLLVLFGDKERGLEWKLNRYCDGSGSWDMCRPFCSIEEAQYFAREMLGKSFAAFKWPDYGNISEAEELVKAAKALSAPIPWGFEAQLRERNIRAIREMVAKADKERSGWQAQLDALDAKVPT